MAFLSGISGPGAIVRVGLFVVAAHLIANLSAQPMDEYHVKAAFLYNFAKFVEWPADAFRNPAEPFAICVLGQDPFGLALDEVTAGKAIAGRPLILRRLSDAGQADGCQIVFVSSSERKHVLATLAAAKRPGILTVGDAGNPTSEGMIIKLTLEGGKVRFEINLGAAEEEKLHISSKLLSLATVVRK